MDFVKKILRFVMGEVVQNRFTYVTKNVVVFSKTGSFSHVSELS